MLYLLLRTVRIIKKMYDGRILAIDRFAWERCIFRTGLHTPLHGLAKGKHFLLYGTGWREMERRFFLLLLRKHCSTKFRGR